MSNKEISLTWPDFFFFCNFLSYFERLPSIDEDLIDREDWDSCKSKMPVESNCFMT